MMNGEAMTPTETMYKTMYAILCKAAAQAVDALAQGDSDLARPILQRALLQAENWFIFESETPEQSESQT